MYINHTNDVAKIIIYNMIYIVYLITAQMWRLFYKCHIYATSWRSYKGGFQGNR